MVQGSKQAEIGEFLRWAYERIADQQLRDALAKMALQIGLMIATGEVAGAAVAAVRGLALAREAEMVGAVIADVRKVGLGYQALEVMAQAYLMTEVQGRMGGPSDARAFTDNLLGMALTTAALQPFEGLFGDAAALEQELHTWSGSAKAGAKLAIKAPIEVGRAYLAPSDYHLLVEPGHFALSLEPPVRFSRPSIDALFETAAAVYSAPLVS